MENIIAVKFIGMAKAMVSLFDKSGLKRLSSWILVFLTALPFALGSTIAGYFALNGLNAPMTFWPLLILLTELAFVTLFYFTRTTSRIWALKHLLKDLGIQLDKDIIKDILSPTPEPLDPPSLDDIDQMLQQYKAYQRPHVPEGDS
jgi:hypothetical protein